MKRVVAALLIAWVGVASAAALSDVPDAALAPFRRLAIQHNGRVKPLDSYARETVYLLTGATQFRQLDSFRLILEIARHPETWQAEPLMALPYRPLRAHLGFDARTTHVSYRGLLDKRTLMPLLPAIVAKQQAGESLTLLEHETFDVYTRFVALTEVMRWELALVPPPVGQREWEVLPLAQWEQAFDWEAGPDTLQAAGQQFLLQLRAVNPTMYPPTWTIELELWYHRLRPFRWAWWLYAASALCLLGIRWGRRVGVAAFGLGMLWHAAGILTRVVLSGHPPVTNFFETMLWLPLVAVLVASVLEAIYRTRYLLFSAALVAALTLALSEQVPLDPHLVPVVAVLRSNKWLTIHVLTIVGSYGALALAMVLAHVYGAVYLRRGRAALALSALEQYLYRVMQVGVVLLAAGIMLGAVWANASWGRYWGWDPKETWALITLLWFLAILHGRIAGWLQGVGQAVATIGGFVLLLMTYYGVSFYLVGLHSYAGGHAKPLPLPLLGYLVGETLFIVAVACRRLALERSEVA